MTQTQLPPDPEGMNDSRAESAACCIRHFQCQTGTDWTDAVCDLLCDLMHFCDREGFDFREELDRARTHYEAETAAPFSSPSTKKENTAMKLYIDEHTDTRVILAVDHAGRHWEIDVRIDLDEDGGIVAEIGRDSILCTSAEFGWHDKHDNEQQD